MEKKKALPTTISNSFENKSLSNKSKSIYEEKFKYSERVNSDLEKKYENIIKSIGGNLGNASVLFADFLFKKHKFNSRIEALEFSVDILLHEDDNFLETLASLLKDGWSQGAGELIRCARKL